MDDTAIESRLPPAGADAQSAAVRLREIIGQIRAAAHPERDMAALEPALRQAEDGWRDVRRLLVSPFIREGRFEPAIAALGVLIAVYPSRVEERRLLASLYGRTQQWSKAIAEADAAAGIEPGNAVLHAARIQLRVQAGRGAEAADLARNTLAVAQSEPGEAYSWMTAFMRNGDVAEAAGIAAALDPDKLPNERVATTAVRALLEDGRSGAAIRLGDAALRAGHDGAALRSVLGRAHLRRGTEEDRKVHALAHFDAGLQAAPDDVRLLTLYGETLLRAGRYKESVAPLARAIELAPELEQTRVLYARALRYTLQYEAAADQLMTLVEKSPDKPLWQRAAIGALSQAGRKEEAEALFTRYIATRSVKLPDTFQEALARMEERLDTAPIPQARLDWAWSLRGDTSIDRATWERRARWGHMVDHLLFDWLECREERAEEAMQLLGELDTGERFFAPLLAAGRGVVVATAHVGPMYAGLMALELLGIPSRWLATAPSIAQTSYSAALISTADQTEAQVAKACMRAINSGYVLCLAVDGAANPAAPRTTFEGQEVTYSAFASHLAYRLGVPSVFYAPRWENGHVAYTLEMLPAANPGEDAQAHSQRWQKAYFERLREHLASEPENLRLSGGIWRHVTSADRSAQQ
ncbi:tetratricopeptide repeat protein [Parapusillimonas granuli]|uniref:Vi polysaccharide transport protein VexE n=1 Tax=Parapusillimonas granuli TaxID=380911 RepID=A0A853FXC7_9BURK|nr:tetratricopeptide repeat protein [Parapusillimonas granuli]MBB5216017.1 tetratricopeptide (TPR) repeat protein [Parapusillimonas granuli]NYT50685.1 Vi polysaccharide transport protein VexE [Parapusillimonas granuli]